MEVLIEALSSWGVVYLVCFGPAVALAFNFLFGDCTVAEAIEEGRGVDLAGKGSTVENSAAPKERVRRFNSGQRRGRLTVLGVYAALAWQYHTFLVLFRDRFLPEAVPRVAAVGMTTPSVRSCSPLHFGWNIVLLISDAIAFTDSEAPPQAIPLTSALAELTMECRTSDVLYLLMAAVFVGLQLSLMYSRPQKQGAELEAYRKKLGEDRVHACSKCAAAVPGMDHHCYFVHNCVSTVENVQRFLGLLTVNACLSWYLVFQCLHWFLYVVIGAQVVHGTLPGASDAGITLSCSSGQADVEKTALCAILEGIVGPTEARLGDYYRSLSILELVQVSSGLAFAMVCAVGGTMLLGFQLLLRLRNTTTVLFFKNCPSNRTTPGSFLRRVFALDFFGNVWALLVAPPRRSTGALTKKQR